MEIGWTHHGKSEENIAKRQGGKELSTYSKKGGKITGLVT